MAKRGSGRISEPGSGGVTIGHASNPAFGLTYTPSKPRKRSRYDLVSERWQSEAKAATRRTQQ